MLPSIEGARAPSFASFGFKEDLKPSAWGNHNIIDIKRIGPNGIYPAALLAGEFKLPGLEEENPASEIEIVGSYVYDGHGISETRSIRENLPLVQNSQK